MRFIYSFFSAGSDVGSVVASFTSTAILSSSSSAPTAQPHPGLHIFGGDLHVVLVLHADMHVMFDRMTILDREDRKPVLLRDNASRDDQPARDGA